MQHITGCPTSVTIELGEITISAIRHTQPDEEVPTRLLCLHGWLDNANSFLPLMPYLPNVDILAIDLPGHGHSDHLNTGYSIPEVAMIVSEVAATFGWEIYNLMGHSLGGCIAPLVAAASPESISNLILIEASGAMSSSAQDFPDRLMKAAHDRTERQIFKSRTMPDKKTAVEARLRAAKMTTPAANLIVERQLQQTPDGYVWRFDPKLRMASPMYLTEEHVEAVLRAVQCPTQTIIANDGFLSERADTEKRLGLLEQRDSVTLPGNHHLHMDTPEPVARAINRFLGTTPALGG